MNPFSIHAVKSTYMQHFLRIALGLGSGIVVGIFFPGLTLLLENCKALFINLLKMCFIPLLVCALVVELSRFIRSYEYSSLRRYFVVLAGFLALSGALAIGTALVFRPGESVNLGPYANLEYLIEKNSIAVKNIDTPVENPEGMTFLDFIRRSITDNIFASLASNQILQIIVFSIIFAVGCAWAPQSRSVVKSFGTTYHVFSRIFDYIVKFLPILVFLSTSLSVMRLGYEIMLGLLPFLGAVCLMVTILFIVNLYVLKTRCGLSLADTLRESSVPLLVAFASSPVASLVPVSSFFQKFMPHNPKEMVGTVVPLSLFLNRFGPILYFSFATLFIGQLYNHTFRAEEIAFVFIFSILYGIATAGVVDELGVAFLGVILEPLGIPIGPTLVVLTSLDFVVSPLLSLLTVQTNMAVIALGFRSHPQERAARGAVRTSQS